jgi:hypothetical protein
MTSKSCIQTEFLLPHLRLTGVLVVYGLAHCYSELSTYGNIDVTINIED